MRDSMTNEDIKLFEKRIARIESWLVTTAEAMQVMLDRVQNPGDFAPDLQRAFDLAAVQGLRETMQAADAMRSSLNDAAVEFVDALDNACDAAYSRGVADGAKSEAVR